MVAKKTKDAIANTARALVKLVPGIGAGADQLIFGALEDARTKRIESMLEEVLDKVGPDAPGLGTEEMATLFESTAAQIARETSRDKRDRLRDLLTNAAALPPEDPRWESTKLASELLSNLGAAELFVLASVVRVCQTSAGCVLQSPGPKYELWSTDGENKIEIPYEIAVVDHAVDRLMENGMITLNRVASEKHLDPTVRAVFLLGWALNDEGNETPVVLID